MAMRCLVVCLMLVAANSIKLQERSMMSNFENEDSAKETPIQRVVKLLGEMKAQLDKEVAADSEMYDKMVCWCETNDKEKTKAIADADASMTDLESDIQGGAARDGELSTNIAAMKRELAEKKKALSTATALREKEAAEFNSEEKEKISAVTMLKNAITIIGKHHAGLIQMTPAIQESMGAALRYVALKHEEMIAMGADSAAEHSALRGSGASHPTIASLLAIASSAGQAKDAANAALDARLLKALSGGHSSAVELPLEFGSRVLARAAGQAAALVQTAQPDGRKSFNPQSGAIFGILKQMKEEFEGDLSSAQKEEITAQEQYAELSSAAKKAIDAGAAKLDEMEEEFAANTKAVSDAKEDFEVTQDQRSADVKFLRNLKLKCKDLDTEFAKRSKARGEEVTAVSETIAILTQDDARTLFNKNNAASFFQEKSSSAAAMQARSRASMVLLAAARKQMPDSDGFPIFRPSDDKPHEQLAAIAVQVQLDAFTKVKKAIDDMVADLKVQQAKEVEKKDFCNKEFDENEKMTYTTQQTLGDLDEQITGLEATLAKLAEQVAAAQKEIADMEVAVKQAGEQREKENSEFQEEITDQRMMQAILRKALERLAKVYGFVQQEPPMKFQPMKQNSGSSPVIGLLEQIIEDSKAVEGDAIEGEKEAQKAYEEFVQNSHDSIEALNNSIQSKSDSIAADTKEKSEAESERKSTQERLEDLGAYNGDLHSDCDFVLKNFDTRQKARLQEMEALQNAKAYLSGQQD